RRRPVLQQPARAARGAGGTLCRSGILRVARIRHGRRADQLWTEHHGCLSPSWHVRRDDPQWRQAGRSPGPATDQIRVGDQPQYRQGARPHCAAINPRPRRRGHRMRGRELMVLLGGALIGSPAALAQQKAMATIGFLGVTSPGPYAPYVAAFREGLSEAGYVEG